MTPDAKMTHHMQVVGDTCTVTLAGISPLGSALHRALVPVIEQLQQAQHESRFKELVLDLLKLDYKWGDGLNVLLVAMLAEGITCAIKAQGTTWSSLEPLLRGLPVRLLDE